MIENYKSYYSDEKFKFFEQPLQYIVSQVYYVNEIKILHLVNTINTMIYNINYNCGTINSSEFKNKYGYTDCVFYGNSRMYEYSLLSSNLIIKCKTNTLPSDGKPNIGGIIVYI